ncbi:hypothetical protein Tco_0936042 [Tanacetum coccineum]
MVKDVSLTCGTSLEVFKNEFNRMSRMDDDLFTYEVKVANISCNSNKDDDSEQRVSHEADGDTGYDPSDVPFTEWLGGDDEVELTNEESSDNEYEVAEVFRIDTNIFDFETPILIKNLRTTGFMDGTMTYLGWTRNLGLTLEYGKNGNQSNILASLLIIKLDIRNGQHVVRRVMDTLKEDALRNKAIIEGLINDDNDDESCYERKKRWNIYSDTNHDHEHKIDHEDGDREELCEIHELPVCNIKIFEMIMYSFGQDEEYVAVKEDKYNDLGRTNDDACRAYQEIFCMIDEGWMVTRAE